jgi:hypothetical protein
MHILVTKLVEHGCHAMQGVQGFGLTARWGRVFEFPSKFAFPFSIILLSPSGKGNQGTQ